MAIGSLYETSSSPLSGIPPLTGDVRADVAIIGGGLTGVSTALHLAQQGARVVLLERHEPGWGASGRNGGQVNPGLKPPPEEVEKDFGPEVGGRLAHLAWNAPDLVFELIERHGIACDAIRGGTLRTATAPSQIPALRELADQCLARGWPVSWLDEAAVQARTGSPYHKAALLDARGGQVDPLAYTRGLTRAAMEAGARICSQSPVVRLRRSARAWQAVTPQGSVTCDKVVVGTNGYSSSLIDPLRRSVIPVYSAIVSSTPLPQALRERIMAQGEVLYELGIVTAYYRVDAQGRLLMGGRSFSHPAQGVASFPFLTAHAEKLWPELGGAVSWTHGWNGQLAMTLDHYPHWHEPQPGLVAALGYNGRGVALATLTGQEIARYLAGEASPLFPFTPIRPVPFHRFWRMGVAAGIVWGRLRDRLAGA
ncbi:glycine/D-amino acid oxidase [Acetobacter estunensis NRIC 0472]|uniref:FAD-dependent oxidoreductase n=2 Tax=Acetobacter estunensis TaxID=104097 RepID=A0A967EC43_9PROT|nr:FAD-dependent oxidoreductase [Acetobacter estunensis]GBQ21394.1 glycine/D-amino acid oxidase [Acetobacter estunensis NRIC 0472]